MKTKGTPLQGLLAATLGFFIGFAAVSLFGPTAKSFRDLMDLSPLMVGILVAMPSLSGSLLRIPFSAWVDTTGGRKPFLVLLSLSVVGMGGLSWVVYALYPDRLTSGLYPLLLLLGLLSGCGIATFSVGISQVSYWFPQSGQGKALGTYAGLGNIAPGLFSLLLPISLQNVGLGGSYLIWLIILVMGTAVYWLIGRNAWYFQFRAAGLALPEARQAAREAGQQLFPSGTLSQSLLLSARVWKTWALVGIYFTTFGGFIALTAWLPTYWTSFFEVSAVAAGGLTALYSVLASLVRVAGGGLSDRLGGERTAILAACVTFAGASIMTFSQSFGVSVAGEILLALGMGVSNAAVFKLVPQEVPHAVGGAAGWVGGLGAFGGFVIPPLMGAFVGSQGAAGYASGFTVFMVLALLSLTLALVLQRSHWLPGVEEGPAQPAWRRLAASQVTTVVLLVALVFNFLILASRLGALNLPGNRQGYEPTQPIAFSHRLHAGELGMSCQYCHYAAEKSRHAGIPAASLCMNCHRYVTAPRSDMRAEEESAAREKRPPGKVVSTELRKLYQGLGLDDDLRPDGKTSPIAWIRVHRLPDYVYFDHRAHLAAGVDCGRCHGAVDSMERVRQAEDLSMGWCVNCHRDAKRQGVGGTAADPSTDCATCHY